MTTEKVLVERYIEQVCDGSHYRGYIEIAGARFDYELYFVVPIARLDYLEPPNELEAIHRLFQLTVKRGEANIELTDKEYDFFFRALVLFAVGFYVNPMTRDSNNQSPFWADPRGDEFISAYSVPVSIGAMNSRLCGFSPELCEMLSAEKFGCALAPELREPPDAEEEKFNCALIA